MCNAFSCLVLKDCSVIWKVGIDSHDNLFSEAGRLGYSVIDDGVREPNFAKVEITPQGDSYLYPEQPWVFRIDETSMPNWWRNDYEEAAWRAFEQWKHAVYSKINLKEVRNPINPLALTPPAIGPKQFILLRQWASVRDSMGESVWENVRESVGESVGDSVWDSVWDNVWYNVRDSVWDNVWDNVVEGVWAYLGSLFYLWPDGYPYQSVVDLWNQGLVPSFDGRVWRLHGGPDMKVLWKGRL